VPLHSSDEPALRVQDLGTRTGRIDIHIEVRAVKYKELRAPSSSEDSSAVRGRVIEARSRQTLRYQGDKATYSNAQMSSSMIRKYCAIDTGRREIAGKRHHPTGAFGACPRPHFWR